MSPGDRRAALRDLVEDFLEEYPTVGFDDPEFGPDAEQGVELLDRLLRRHRLELVDVDERRAGAAA